MPADTTLTAGAPAPAPPTVDPTVDPSVDPTVDVVICCYTEQRWDDLVAAVESVDRQERPAARVLVVVDHNDRLLARCRAAFPSATVLANRSTQGLSGARTTGVTASTADVVAFLDDDATADPSWLTWLADCYRDPGVAMAGGLVVPFWPDGHQAWLPEEFGWVVGCSYTGQPIVRTEVRNPIGANMSARRAVLDAVGGFDRRMGRIGSLPVGCEETELAIRIRQAGLGTTVHEPRAVVHHRVAPERTTASYFLRRCYHEGRSKAALTTIAGSGDALAAERAHVATTLRRSATGDLAALLRPRRAVAAATHLVALAAGLTATVLGYLTGRIRRVSTVAAAPTARRPRVAVVTPRFAPFTGGIETHVAEVVRRIGPAGTYDLEILTADPTGALPRRARLAGATVRRSRAWPAERDWMVAPGIAWRVLRGRYDLVHCQGIHTFVPPLAMLAARLRGVPYLVTFHTGGHSSGRRHALRRLQWRPLAPLLRQATALVAVSRHEVELFGHALGLPSERFTLVRNGAELPVPAGEAEITGSPLVCSVGRLERYKGHDRAIAAFAELRSSHPGAHLAVVGGGPHEAALRAQVHQLGLDAAVTFTCFGSDERSAYAQLVASADVVVLLSEYEAHPVAIMEAVALGRPVLAARTSGLVELEADGLIRGVDLDAPPATVAQAILATIGFEPPVTTLGSWGDCAQAVDAVYREALAA